MAFPATTARYVLFLLNLVFLVSAIAVAVVSILIEWTFLRHNIFLTQDWTSPPVLVVIACGVILLTSLFGCCGVIRESRGCLIVYAILLFVVVFLEIAIGIHVFSTKDTIAASLQKDMLETLPKYSREPVVQKSWDALQHDFKCCGVTNATDWFQYTKDRNLPSSCCIELPLNEKCPLAKASKSGCYSLFAQFVQSKSLTLAGIAIGVGIAQMLCSIASGFLARHINRQYEAV